MKVEPPEVIYINPWTRTWLCSPIEVGRVVPTKYIRADLIEEPTIRSVPAAPSTLLEDYDDEEVRPA